MWGPSYPSYGSQTNHHRTFTYGSYNPMNQASFVPQGTASTPWTPQASPETSNRSLWGNASTATNYSDTPQELQSQSSFSRSPSWYGNNRTGGFQSAFGRHSPAATPSFAHTRNARSAGDAGSNSYAQNGSCAATPAAPRQRGFGSLPYSGSAYNFSTARNGGGNNYYSGSGQELQRTSSAFGFGADPALRRVSSGYGELNLPNADTGMVRQLSFMQTGYGGGYTRPDAQNSTGTTSGTNASSGSYSSGAVSQEGELSRANSFAALQPAFGSMYNFGLNRHPSFTRQGSFSSLSAQPSYGSLSRSDFGSFSFSSPSFYGTGNQSFRDGYSSFRDSGAGTTSAYNIRGFDSTVGCTNDAAAYGDSAVTKADDYSAGTGVTGDFGGVDVNSTSPATIEAPAVQAPTYMSRPLPPMSTNSHMNSRMANQNTYATPPAANNPPALPRSHLSWSQGDYMCNHQSPAQKEEKVTPQNTQRRYSAPVTGTVVNPWAQQSKLGCNTPSAPSHSGEMTGAGNSKNQAKPSSRMQRPHNWAGTRQTTFAMYESISPNAIGRNRSGGRRLTFSGEEVM